VIIRDISERKAAEKALRENEQRLRMALQAARGGVWDWNLAEDEAWWSPEMYHFWGMAPGTRITLENSLAPVHEEDREHLRCAVAGAIAGRKNLQTEFRINHTDRGLCWVASLGRVICDEAGEPRRLAGVSFDITELKFMQGKMLQAEKMLSLGGLSAGMAHEINNPLSIILHGAANLERRIRGRIPGNFLAAEECGLDLDRMERYFEKRNIFQYVKAIKKSAEPAAELVQTMLEFGSKSDPTDAPKTSIAFLRTPSILLRRIMI
jgi:signal transduction histidine kinase